MSIYPEIPTSETRHVDGVAYMVRKYGLNNKVFEEELVPIPAEKKIITLKSDGTEDVTKTKTVAIKK